MRCGVTRALCMFLAVVLVLSSNWGMAALVAASSETAVHPPATGQSPGTHQFELLGQSGGGAGGIDVAGTHAYLGMGPRLLALDVSDPDQPQTVGETGILSGMVGAVRLLGQRILADVAGELAIIDVADPAHPALVSTFAIPGSEPIADIEAAGEYAYVLTRSRFTIITIADPLHPALVGVYEAEDDLYDAHVVGVIAYLAAGAAGLQVIDMVDPSHPTVLGSAAGPAGGATGLWVAGGYAYVVGPYGFRGNEVVLTVLDVSAATHPFVVGEYVDIPSSERYLHRVQVVGHYAFAYGEYYDSRGEYSAVWIADVSHPGEPPFGAARFEMLHRITDFRLLGERLYATIEGGGLEILDATSPGSLSVLATHYPGIGPLLDVSIEGSHATVISSRPQVVPFFGRKPDGDLSIVDVVDPRQPSEVARMQTPSDTKSVVLAGAYAYHIDSRYETSWIVDELHATDLSDPQHPAQRGSLSSLDALADLAAVGEYLYVAQNLGQQYDPIPTGVPTATLMIVDVSDPDDPMKVGATSLEVGEATAVGASGALACVGAYPSSAPRHVWVVDTADPAHPIARGFCELPDPMAYARQIQILGDYAYVAAGAALYIIDLSDPGHPSMVGNYTDGRQILAVQVDGSRAVLVVDAIDGFWLVALDISDPTQPVVMARQSLIGRAARCDIEDDLVYVAASSGLWIYHLGQATTEAQVLDWHDPLCIGWKQRYTLSFSNGGDITLTGVRMVNTLPDASLDVLLGESSPGAVYDGDSTVAWEIGEVAPGEAVTRSLEIRLWSNVPAGTVLTDCLAVSSDQLSVQTACADTLVVDCPQVTPTSTPSPVFTVTATPTLGPTNTPTRDPSPTRYAVHLPLLVK